jgi:hypothetical protein
MIPGKTELEHQPLHPLPVDPVPLPSQVVCHSPAAVERMPGELLIDQNSLLYKCLVFGAGVTYKFSYMQITYNLAYATAGQM